MTQEGSLSYAAKVQARFDKDRGEPEDEVIDKEDTIAISFRAKKRWIRALGMIVRANRVRRAMSGALRRRAPKGESLLEKMTFLERKVLLDEATQRRKLGELEMSMKNLAMHMQGFDSNLATWKNDSGVSSRNSRTPEQKVNLSAKMERVRAVTHFYTLISYILYFFLSRLYHSSPAFILYSFIRLTLASSHTLCLSPYLSYLILTTGEQSSKLEGYESQAVSSLPVA